MTPTRGPSGPCPRVQDRDPGPGLHLSIAAAGDTRVLQEDMSGVHPGDRDHGAEVLRDRDTGAGVPLTGDTGAEAGADHDPLGAGCLLTPGPCG